MASEGAEVPSPGVTTGGTGSHNSVLSGFFCPCAKIPMLNRIKNRKLAIVFIIKQIFIMSV